MLRNLRVVAHRTSTRHATVVFELEDMAIRTN